MPASAASPKGEPDYASFQPSRVEIDIAALAANARLIRNWLGARIGFMAVVKANAYGHGAVTVARTVLRNGVDCLAVANLPEALQLRQAGILAPILVLSYVPVAAVSIALQHDIAIALYDRRQIPRFEQAARRAGGKLKTHIKFDTGMGRLGILPTEVMALTRDLRACEALLLEGVYTHFSAADEDPPHTARQLAAFEGLLATMREAGCAFKYAHAGNSAAISQRVAGSLNLARPGLLLYGLKPAVCAPDFAPIQPVMSWKTVIAQVKTLPPGSPVGYGNSYHTRGSERIAVLPVGYADGLRRSPRTWRQVLVRGRRASLVGRVSMEKTTINVSHIPEARAGDEVVLLGKQGGEHISADEVAAWLGSINYEVLTTILPRVPRP